MTVEVWKSVRNFVGLYEVSNLGRVRSLQRVTVRSTGASQPVRQCIRKTPLVRGYPSLFLCDHGIKTFTYVHNLVAVAFIGPRPIGKEVAHADGKKRNIKLSNLRYATPVENDADKIRHGTRPNGERNGRAKLTEMQVRQIRKRSQDGERLCDLANIYNSSANNLCTIASRKSWRHVK